MLVVLTEKTCVYSATLKTETLKIWYWSLRNLTYLLVHNICITFVRVCVCEKYAWITRGQAEMGLSRRPVAWAPPPCHVPSIFQSVWGQLGTISIYIQGPWDRPRQERQSISIALLALPHKIHCIKIKTRCHTWVYEIKNNGLSEGEHRRMGRYGHIRWWAHEKAEKGAIYWCMFINNNCFICANCNGEWRDAAWSKQKRRWCTKERDERKNETLRIRKRRWEGKGKEAWT